MIILNQREYRLAKARLPQLQAALSPESVIENLTSALSAEVTNARQHAIRAEIARLSQELANYEKLHASGAVPNDLSTDDLGLLPIIGRIARGMSQRELADLLDVSEQQIQRYESDRYSSISLSRFMKVLDILGIDTRAKLRTSWRSVGQAKQSASVPEFQIDSTILSELRKKDWVSLPRGISREDATKILSTYVQEASELTRDRALHRRHSRGEHPLDDAGLAIWQARAMRQALIQRPSVKAKFNLLSTNWVEKLAGLSTRTDGPVRAVGFLREHGILLVIVPHLPHTRLDGAAMMMADGTPIIALTLRYDRIDSFWFTLFHEIGHVLLHFNHGLEDGFLDDLDAGTQDSTEREADLFATSALIPDGVWSSAPARFARSADLVTKFAESLGLHPAIVAGRIRKERGNYRIFNELLGSGQIRKLFAEQLS
jgi:HTH-type transcriptional regulator/antitoxin HigA